MEIPSLGTILQINAMKEFRSIKTVIDSKREKGEAAASSEESVRRKSRRPKAIERVSYAPKRSNPLNDRCRRGGCVEWPEEV